MLKSFLMSLGLLASLGLAGQTPAKKLRGGLVHNVYFWLKNPESAADRAALNQGLQQLLAIKTIQAAYIGEPAPTMERGVIDTSYTYSLILIFKSPADQDAYQVDPIHLEFVKNHQHLWERVVVYDVLSAGRSSR